jgi:hypothetical protein
MLESFDFLPISVSRPRRAKHARTSDQKSDIGDHDSIVKGEDRCADEITLTRQGTSLAGINCLE